MESGVRQTGTAAAFPLSFRPVTAFPFSHALLFMTLPLTRSPLSFRPVACLSFPSCPSVHDPPLDPLPSLLPSCCLPFLSLMPFCSWPSPWPTPLMFLLLPTSSHVSSHSYLSPFSPFLHAPTYVPLFSCLLLFSSPCRLIFLFSSPCHAGLSLPCPSHWCLSFDGFPHLPVLLFSGLLFSGFLSRLFSFFAPFPPLSSFSSPLLLSSSSFLLSPLPPLPCRAEKVTIRCTQGVWTSCVGTQPKQIFL